MRKVIICVAAVVIAIAFMASKRHEGIAPLTTCIHKPIIKDVHMRVCFRAEPDAKEFADTFGAAMAQQYAFDRYAEDFLSGTAYTAYRACITGGMGTRMPMTECISKTLTRYKPLWLGSVSILSIDVSIKAPGPSALKETGFRSLFFAN